MMGFLLNFNRKSLAGCSNKGVVGLGKPGSIGVDLVCNKDIFICALVS